MVSSKGNNMTRLYARAIRSAIAARRDHSRIFFDGPRVVSAHCHHYAADHTNIQDMEWCQQCERMVRVTDDGELCYRECQHLATEDRS